MRSLFTLLTAFCFVQFSAFPQTRGASKAALAGPANPTSLAQLSASLQDIARKAEPSVVQIFNSSYAIERSGEAVVLQQRNSGSGILIASDGYIVTNAHAVEGSRRLQVRLNAAASNIGSRFVKTPS
jgi:S1-C subfamily serine protease